jgi:phosphoglycolate phosphatase-like HAD superfamily hydrolase
MIPGQAVVELGSRHRTKNLLLTSICSFTDIKHLFQFEFGIDNKFAGSKIERGLELIKVSNIPASETVMVGDTLHDLEVANALGIEAILISHGHQCSTRLKLHHEKVIEV